MTVVGIDLGTTNSCISFYNDGRVQVIDIDGRPTVPSVVAHNGTAWLFGQAAANHMMLRPGEAVRSFKRRMGDNQCRLPLGNLLCSPRDLSSRLLGYLKEEAEKSLGQPVKDAVITVPAWFHDSQRRDTLEAGKQAGFNVLRLVNEPTAAAIAYDAFDMPADNTEEYWVVYDLGGGTFDVSVLKVSTGHKEILASSGDSHLGGDDFDHRLYDWLLTQIKDNATIAQDPLANAALMLLAEQIKIRLSTETEMRVQTYIKGLERTYELDLTVERNLFEGLIHPLVGSTIHTTEKVLSEARLKPDQVSRLLLVGGSTRIPLVRESLEGLIHLTPDIRVHPDLSVSLGAGRQAALAQGLCFDQTVIDVASRSLGVAAFGALDERQMESYDFNEDDDEHTHPLTFAPIIKRNTPLPARFMEKFITAVPWQTRIQVAVYQGESEVTRQNEFIGSFYVDLTPKPERIPIHITFEYNASGIIQVSVAQERSEAEIKRYRMDLKCSARANSEMLDGAYDDEDVSNAPIMETANPEISNLLVQKVERVLVSSAESDRRSIEDVLDKYRAALAQSDDDQLDDLEDQLYDWLDKYESVEQP